MNMDHAILAGGSWIAPLLLGLSSSLHCLGMCGGIIGAITMSLPVEVRANRFALLLHLLALSLGRLCSYTLAGVGAGLLGQGTFGLIGPAAGHQVLQFSAAVVLIVAGIHLSGRFPSLAFLEKIGVPLWSRIEPFWRHLLPLRSPVQGIFLGIVWGWMPCFLVYATLLLSLSMATPLQGGWTMFLFGIGTLPVVMATGFLTGVIMQWRHNIWMRWVVSVFLVVAGILTLPGVA
ncbi:MAG: sulfite exporter TauE/SafE family protein [Magnetococcus sp. DMHC-1]